MDKYQEFFGMKRSRKGGWLGLFAENRGKKGAKLTSKKSKKDKKSFWDL